MNSVTGITFQNCSFIDACSVAVSILRISGKTQVTCLEQFGNTTHKSFELFIDDESPSLRRPVLIVV